METMGKHTLQDQTTPLQQQATKPTLPLTYKVMTKLGDGQEMKSTSSPVDDAFAKYSNDGVRLKRILLKDDNFDLQDFASRHFTTAEKMNLSTNNNDASSPQDRKTRISFEAHPSLIIDEMLDTLQDNGHGINDEDEDVDLFGYFDMLRQ